RGRGAGAQPGIQVVPVHAAVDPAVSGPDGGPDGDAAAGETGGHVRGRAGGVEAGVVEPLDDALDVNAGGVADEGPHHAREGVLRRLGGLLLPRVGGVLTGGAGGVHPRGSAPHREHPGDRRPVPDQGEHGDRRTPEHPRPAEAGQQSQQQRLRPGAERPEQGQRGAHLVSETGDHQATCWPRLAIASETVPHRPPAPDAAYQKTMPSRATCLVSSFLNRMMMARVRATAGMVTPGTIPWATARRLPTRAGASLKTPPAEGDRGDGDGGGPGDGPEPGAGAPVQGDRSGAEGVEDERGRGGPVAGGEPGGGVAGPVDEADGPSGGGCGGVADEPAGAGPD